MFPGDFGGPGMGPGGFGGRKGFRGPPGFDDYGSYDRMPGGMPPPFGRPMQPPGFDPLRQPGNSGRVDIDLMGPAGPMDPDQPYFGMPDIPEFRQRNINEPPAREVQPQNPLRDFAPPGTMPGIGSPNSPNLGVDGQGSLVVGPPKNSKPIARGDYDQMQKMGLFDPRDDDFNRNLYS